jgi:hypothetical protein
MEDGQVGPVAFEVGGRKYTREELESMPVQEFMALHAALREERDRAKYGSGPVAVDAEPVREVEPERVFISAPQRETHRDVVFSFKGKVLANDASAARALASAKANVERILSRSLHEEVSVQAFFSGGFISEDVIRRMEGDAFERPTLGAVETYGPEDMHSEPRPRHMARPRPDGWDVT